MNNKIIFEDKIFDLPIIRKETDVVVFVEDLFSKFLDTIEKFDGSLYDKLNDNRGYIQQECKLIIDALKLYYSGKINEAFLKIQMCLKVLKSNNLLEVGTLTGRDFYRIRTSTNKNLVKGDLFHIPFNLRVKVGTQRYSIPGLPCLYLADSIYVAWEELDRPNFDSVNVSRFNFENSDLKILFFNVSSDEMRKRCFNGKDLKFENQLVKYISYWPLLAACSLRVLKRDEIFKPEYIIPQMVLQYVILDDSLDGIQFKSNRVVPSMLNVGSFDNVVLPVKSLDTKGYCKILTSKIKLTSPLSWSLLDISDPDKSFLAESKNEDINIDDISRSYYIEVIEGEKTEYKNSKFGILEKKLLKMPLGLIKD